MDCSLPGSSAHGILPVKNTGEGCHALLQGIFPIRELNPCLLCPFASQASSLALAPLGKPNDEQEKPKEKRKEEQYGNPLG